MNFEYYPGMYNEELKEKYSDKPFIAPGSTGTILELKARRDWWRRRDSFCRGALVSAFYRCFLCVDVANAFRNMWFKWLLNRVVNAYLDTKNAFIKWRDEATLRRRYFEQSEKLTAAEVKADMLETELQAAAEQMGELEKLLAEKMAQYQQLKNNYEQLRAGELAHPGHDDDTPLKCAICWATDDLELSNLSFPDSCGHACVCSTCMANTNSPIPDRCPICRKDVQNWVSGDQIKSRLVYTKPDGSHVIIFPSLE